MVFSLIFADEQVQAPPAAHDDFWYQPIATTSSGVKVNAYTAMQVSSLYACVRVLASTIASLPKNVMRKTVKGVVKAPDHPLQDVINKKPNNYQTAYEFWYMQIAFGMLYGNMYAKKVPGSKGSTDQLIPMRPDNVTVEQLKNGNLRYKYKDPLKNNQVETLLSDEVLHIPSFSFDGIAGIAPIYFAGNAIGLAVATEVFGSQFFSKNATPAVALEYPGSLKDEVARKNIINSWKRQHSGLNNSFSVAVLEEGMKIHQLTMANKDTQYLETRKHQIAELCRFFGIPLHMVNELEKSSFNNIEQQSIEFYKNTIRPECYKIEQRIDTDLIEQQQTYHVRHDYDELLKGETKARFESYASAVNTGWLTRNEVREREGYDPLPGLDEPLTPLNMQKGDEAAALMPVIRDLAERIAGAECDKKDQLLTKFKKVDDAMIAKTTELAEKHKKYAYNVLKPFVDLCENLIDTKINITGVINYCEASIAGEFIDNFENKAKTTQLSKDVAMNKIMVELVNLFEDEDGQDTN